MSFNLIDTAKSLFTNELVSKLATHFGENESGVAKAITGIIPSVVSGLANKATNHEGAATITKFASEYHQAGILNGLDNFLSPNNNLLNNGAALVNNLFGGSNANQLSSLISNFAGIKSSSATSLLGMATPAILALLGRHAANSSVGSTSITTALSHHFGGSFPAGLSLGSLFGNAGGKATSTVRDSNASAQKYVESTNDSGGALKWLLPLLLIALAAVLAWYFCKDGCNKKATDAVATADSSIKANTDTIKNSVASAIGKVDSLTGDFLYNEGDTVTIDLQNNAGKLTVGKNSTEYRLINFLNDKNAVLDTVKGNWYEFTNVHFKSGTSTLTDGSMAQLKNMAVIFKAFPTAQFKFGGYTDSTGDAAMNVALSQKRADLVAATIKKLGAPATSIVSAKGYGKEWPLADNATVEGRAMNRRVAVNVKAK